MIRKPRISGAKARIGNISVNLVFIQVRQGRFIVITTGAQAVVGEEKSG